MSLVLDGKIAAKAWKETLKEKIDKLPVQLCLAILHFNDPASLSYLKGRKKIAAELNIEIQEYAIEEQTTQEELLKLIQSLNACQEIHGIMIDRPVPKKFDEATLLSAIDEKKDVDGYTPANLGKLLSNQPCYRSCTPGAAMALLEYYNISLEAKNALIIGRSINVGKPLALMLLNQNATVTIAHSKTIALKELTQTADIIFLAVGKKDFLHLADVKKESIIVDIGINYDENGKICGDASKDLYDQVKAYSPVPGGVGVLTNLVLMQNVYQAYQENENGN